LSSNRCGACFGFVGARAAPGTPGEEFSRDELCELCEKFLSHQKILKK
jgi:hypothetical protein